MIQDFVYAWDENKSKLEEYIRTHKQEEYDEYVKFPEMTRQRMFYETMEEVLPGMKIVIESSDGDVQTLLPLDSFYESDGNGSNSGNTGSSDAYSDLPQTIDELMEMEGY